MGIYLNPGAKALQQARKSEIYVDKSGLIARLNRIVDARERFICVSRPRRFGKTMAADMVCAYYDRTVDGAAEFEGLEIAKDPSFDANRNCYDVIHVNMVDFLAAEKDVDKLIGRLQSRVARELARVYPDLLFRDLSRLPDTMADVYTQTGVQFVVVIDEWDCVMREKTTDEDSQRWYLDFLRTLLKDRSYVALAYMTGILPVKKYGAHSALNMFTELSMLRPLWMAPYTGFTEAEVRSLCKEWDRNFAEVQDWYDGYRLSLPGVRGQAQQVVRTYAPHSVVMAVSSGEMGSWWNQTETFDALRRYIVMDFDGLRDKVTRLVAGERVSVNTGMYTNDLGNLASADDVLTLLVHLGYLGFEMTDPVGIGDVFVSNREVAAEFANSVLASPGRWTGLARSLADSKDLVEALLTGDADAVAEGVARAHEGVASVITYNNEADLAATLRVALYAASSRFRLVREAPAGKGFADLAMVPLASSPGPGVVVELKVDGTADEALAQIHERNYAQALDGLATGGLVLCGIAYDSRAKTHTCRIELQDPA